MERPRRWRERLLDRRSLLRGGAAFAAAMTGYVLSDSAAAQQLVDDPWSAGAGGLLTEYGTPGRFEKNVARTLSNPKGEARTSHARTPHHLLNGTITPNGLHFIISHSGNPDIDPGKHRLVIHGLVQKPLVFTLDALMRYPMVSRMAFVECGGNGALLASKEPLNVNVQALHGLVSCAEWTGVFSRCSMKLASTRKANGIAGRWRLSPVSRSVPISRRSMTP